MSFYQQKHFPPKCIKDNSPIPNTQRLHPISSGILVPEGVLVPAGALPRPFRTTSLPIRPGEPLEGWCGAAPLGWGRPGDE